MPSVLTLLATAALVLAVAVAEAVPAPPPTTCGGVTVPYPFGISAGCFLPGFNLTCDDRSHNRPARLLLPGDGSAASVQITGIFLHNATMRVLHAASINLTSVRHTPAIGTLGLPGNGSEPFVLSYEHNRFVFVGCGLHAFLWNTKGQRSIAGCQNYCKLDDPRHWIPTAEGGCGECSGNGCCQASIPTYEPILPSYRVEIAGVTHSKVLRFVALIAEKGWIEGVWCRMGGPSWPFRRLPPPDLSMVPVVLDWAYPGTAPDDLDEASSICKSNHSFYVDMANPFRSGYTCRCTPGYYGNPYLVDGCQDIDECADPDQYPCYGECTNLPGMYQCRCPKGFHGNSSMVHGCVRSSTDQIIRLGVGSGALLLVLALGTIFLVHKFKAYMKKKIRQRFFKQNHGQLLQQLVCQRADIGERMIITLEELEKATNNFDKSCELGAGAHGTVYKGILSGKHVAIKKSKIVIQKEINDFINEVSILSQVNHRNIVKLIGCCLEMEVPLLIYEFISNGTLYKHLHVRFPISLSWKDRLRIAVETARALTYLHSFASTPIIHRDIKSPNILLDDNLTVKLSDFGESRYIPIDQEGIHTNVQGTLGYLDPMYHNTGHLTEKSDVYSFGVLLIELLTRKKPVSYKSPQGFALADHFVSLLSDGKLVEILDPQVANEGDGEVVDVALLAAKCVKYRSDERLVMREVEILLENIQASKEFYSDVTDDDTSGEGTNLRQGIDIGLGLEEEESRSLLKHF
ncbi:unnamed protein product [Urochloa decumbens]|uniref:Protein kinase domain-containing protein n=1 Tax=Urochloa decumbens TaxID=240449 RepID=A0ABC9B8L5_9POAL